jgi:hypothetical protein
MEHVGDFISFVDFGCERARHRGTGIPERKKSKNAMRVGVSKAN